MSMRAPLPEFMPSNADLGMILDAIEPSFAPPLFRQLLEAVQSEANAEAEAANECNVETAEKALKEAKDNLRDCKEAIAAMVEAWDAISCAGAWHEIAQREEAARRMATVVDAAREWVS